MPLGCLLSMGSSLGKPSAAEGFSAMEPNSDGQSSTALEVASTRPPYCAMDGMHRPDSSVSACKRLLNGVARTAIRGKCNQGSPKFGWMCRTSCCTEYVVAPTAATVAAPSPPPSRPPMIPASCAARCPMPRTCAQLSGFIDDWDGCTTGCPASYKQTVVEVVQKTNGIDCSASTVAPSAPPTAAPTAACSSLPKLHNYTWNKNAYRSWGPFTYAPGEDVTVTATFSQPTSAKKCTLANPANNYWGYPWHVASIVDNKCTLTFVGQYTPKLETDGRLIVMYDGIPSRGADPAVCVERTSHAQGYAMRW